MVAAVDGVRRWSALGGYIWKNSFLLLFRWLCLCVLPLSCDFVRLSFVSLKKKIGQIAAESVYANGQSIINNNRTEQTRTRTDEK